MAYQSNMRQEHAASVQQVLAERTREGPEWAGEALAERTGLRPDELNEAVERMVQRGYAACDDSEGRRQRAFTTVRLTPEGWNHYEQRSHA